MSYILAILDNWFCSTSHCNSKSCSSFNVSNTGSSPNNIPCNSSSNMSNCYYSTKRLACGSWLPPGDTISPMAHTGLYSDTISNDNEYITCHIIAIDALLVRFVYLIPPVRHIRYPTCTTNHHWLRAVITRT
jgi:hypothetical protein